MGQKRQKEFDKDMKKMRQARGEDIDSTRQELLNQFEQLSQRRILLRGNPGIGKSFLLNYIWLLFTLTQEDCEVFFLLAKDDKPKIIKVVRRGKEIFVFERKFTPVNNPFNDKEAIFDLDFLREKKNSNFC